MKLENKGRKQVCVAENKEGRGRTRQVQTHVAMWLPAIFLFSQITVWVSVWELLCQLKMQLRFKIRQLHDKTVPRAQAQRMYLSDTLSKCDCTEQNLTGDVWHPQTSPKQKINSEWRVKGSGPQLISLRAPLSGVVQKRFGRHAPTFSGSLSSHIRRLLTKKLCKVSIFCSLPTHDRPSYSNAHLHQRSSSDKCHVFLNFDFWSSRGLMLGVLWPTTLGNHWFKP